METKQEFYLLQATDCTFLQKWSPLGYSEGLLNVYRLLVGNPGLPPLGSVSPVLAWRECLCDWRKWHLVNSGWLLRTRTLINQPAASLSSTVRVTSVSQSPFQPHSLCLCHVLLGLPLLQSQICFTRSTTVSSNPTHLVPPTLNTPPNRNSMSPLFQTKKVSSSRGVHTQSRL